MSKVRQDKFKVGDKVVLSERLTELALGFSHNWLQDGSVYTISEVKDVPYHRDELCFNDPYTKQSNHQSMGHTQHVRVAESPIDRWSGAFWVLADSEASNG